MSRSTGSDAQGRSGRQSRRERIVAARSAAAPVAELTAAEKEEAELAEKARQQGGGMFDGPAPGKADHFGPSFKRMIGLLRPSAAWFVLVSVCGAIGVVLSVAAPKILGEATNIVYEGFISKVLGDNGFPIGMSQEQVVDGLRQAGQGTFADMVAAMDDFSVGDGVDFERLRLIILAVMAIYIVAAVLSWLQGYVINVIMVRTMWKLREDVEAKINRLPLSYFDKVQRGELISRVTNDIDNITQTMQQSLSGALTSVLTVV